MSLGGTATSGAANGGVSSTGGAANGGVSSTGGVANGGVSSAGSSSGGVGNVSGAPAAGASGAPPKPTQDPITLCGESPLPGGIYCSEAAVCTELGCGKPWSKFDANGCRRRSECSFGGSCPSTDRCLPAILTDFSKSCFSDTDGCEDSSGSCECLGYACYPREVCVDAKEFPTGDECRIDAFSCTELRTALANLNAYVQSQYEEESGTMSKEAEALVTACLGRVTSAITETCP